MPRISNWPVAVRLAVAFAAVGALMVVVSFRGYTGAAFAAFMELDAPIVGLYRRATPSSTARANRAAAHG